MAELKRTSLSLRAERAVLIHVQERSRDGNPEEPLAELRSLAQTARAVVVGELTQRRNQADRRYYIGKGKVGELKQLCRTTDAELVICDDDLKPAQIKALEESLEVKVVDRSEVILDIFAAHARTKQAKLQVELAQLEYSLPRLKRMWTHLDRTAGGTLGGSAGGGIGVRGPGEKQLEVDRRLVQRRVHELKKELEKTRRRRRRMVRDRNESFATAVLVGYTNAGKSSIMNLLTGAGMVVRDRLFETLDTRTRAWELPDGRTMLLSDTVGFIRKLPHHLVASFQATLVEAREADLLLHVIDASRADSSATTEAVREVLKEIGCAHKPIIHLLNKIDCVEDAGHLPLLKQKLGSTVATSAVTGRGMDVVARRVQQFLDDRQDTLTVVGRAGNGRLNSFLYDFGVVLKRSYDDDGAVEFQVRLPHHLTGSVEELGGEIRGADSASWRD